MLFFFIKICLIYIFDIDQLEKNYRENKVALNTINHYRETWKICWTIRQYAIVVEIWTYFDLLESIREISNFSNSSHLELRTRLSHTIFERDQGPRTITARYGVIFQWFQKIDLNVKSLGRTTDGCKKMAIIHINDKGTDDDTNVNSFINHFMYVFIWHQGEFVYKWFLLFLLSWQHIWLL